MTSKYPLKKMGAIQGDKCTANSFLLDIPIYEFTIGDVKVYFSQCDFTDGIDLRKKELWDFHIMNDLYRASFKVTNELINDIEYIKKEIKDRLPLSKE